MSVRESLGLRPRDPAKTCYTCRGQVETRVIAKFPDGYVTFDINCAKCGPFVYWTEQTTNSNGK